MVYKGIFSYIDPDWAGENVERKFTSDYLVTYNGASFSWSSKRKSIGKASRIRGEHISMSKCVREALSICKLMNDFGVDMRDAQG